MRRRILFSTLVVVAITALALGAPLLVAARQLVADFTQSELSQRLDQVTERLEGTPNATPDPSDIELAIPAGSRLEISRVDQPTQVFGAASVPDPIVVSAPFEPGGTLTLSQPSSVMSSQQTRVLVVVALLVLISVTSGAVVATLTARRLAEPLRDVAARAARLGAGDFRRAPARYDIVELDRVSEVLDSSAAALAELMQRERVLVGDVSHQLRSRITALQLLSLIHI